MMRGTTLLASVLLLAGCGGSHLTKQQRQMFADQVAPELRRVLTNASIAVTPFQLVNARPVIGGTAWDARMDNYSFTLESRASTVRLLSLVASPEIQTALNALREPLADHSEFYRFISTTNQQIQQVAEALGYRHGLILPGKQVGITLEWGRSPNGPAMALNGGNVGLYSVSTNLDSIDLVVLVHRGAVKAILQRP